MDFTLGEVADVLDVCLEGEERMVVKGISIDSRTLEKGMLFFAIRGGRFDGHDFVEEAFTRGACGVVVARAWATTQDRGHDGVLAVEDPLRALQDVASYYRRKLGFPVIAVTGSNGKTTTKEMIAAVLGTKYRVMKSLGNLNNHIGVALSVCAWEKHGEIAVVEMGTNHFGEIRRLCEIARPTHGLITNIGKGHLAFLDDLEGVARAKAELLESLAEGGEAFLNGDDPYLYPLRRIVGKTLTYGFSDACDFRGMDVGVDGFGFPRMRLGGRKLKLSVPGQHNLYNGLAAAAVGRVFGVPWEDVHAALEGYRPMDKRMEVLQFGGIVVLNDTYNANPTSVHEALSTLTVVKEAKRRVVVLGDMLELGEKSQSEHQSVGEWVVAFGMDGFFAYGPETKVAVERSKVLGMKHAVHFESKIDLLEALIFWLQNGDIVLVKGSRGMQMEDVVEGLREKFQDTTQE